MAYVGRLKRRTPEKIVIEKFNPSNTNREFSDYSIRPDFANLETFGSAPPRGPLADGVAEVHEQSRARPRSRRFRAPFVRRDSL